MMMLAAAAGVVSLAGLGMAYSRREEKFGPRPRADFTGEANSGYNILFILSDQERTWDLYPKGFIETHAPGRRWLLENGVYVEGAYTPTQICSTARGIIYSGQHSQTNGVWENVPIPFADDLRPDAPTMGTLLQDAGYRTGYAGKWHLTKLHPEGVPLPPEEANAEIRAYGFDETELSAERDGMLAGFNQDGATVDESLRFIQRNKGQDQPWFLAVNLVNPHDIMHYTANDEMTRSRLTPFPDPSNRPPDTPLYNADLGYDVIGPWGEATRAGKPDSVTEYALTYEAAMGYMPFDDTSIARDFQNYYWNCTRDCDQQLKRLLDGLAASGQLERTIIVFTSDHGEYLGVHGLRGKGKTGYREASNVPLVIVHPDGPKGIRSPAIFSHVDIVPTLLGFAGVRPAALQEKIPSLRGLDLSGLLWSEGFNPRADGGLLLHWTPLTFIHHEAVQAFVKVFTSSGLEREVAKLRAIRQVDWTKRGMMRGVYDGRWKFARYFSPGDHHIPADWATLSSRNDLELYDTAADPNEIRNLASDPDHRRALLAMNAKTNALIAKEIGADLGKYIPGFAR